MTPIPPSAILFVLQAGYPADVIMPIALDSINGIHNVSKRVMRHAGDPRFNRLVQLLRSLQLAEAVEVRIEHSKDGSRTSLITFTSNQDPQAKAESAEVRSLLGLRPDSQRLAVYYGGYSGKPDEISMMTRSNAASHAGVGGRGTGAAIGRLRAQGQPRSSRGPGSCTSNHTSCKH